jgi:hypothetical protein
MAETTATLSGAYSSSAQATAQRDGYIAGPGYDRAFFIFSPLLALGIAVFAFQGWAVETRTIGGVTRTHIGFFIATWTYAHLIAVVFRSHLNPGVFRLHPARFLLVPVVVAAFMSLSNWALICGVVLAVYWDIYHTSAQNFGFCRIYDSRLGNPADAGRQLDFWLNHFLYIGPILAGPSLGFTLSTLNSFTAVEWKQPALVARDLVAMQSVITTLVIAGGAAYLAFYVYSYRKLTRNGYRISQQKLALLVSTGIASIGAWGFMRPIEAMFVSNFFHGLQYFAIVWWSEGKHVTGKLLENRTLALAVYLGSIFVFGFLYVLYGVNIPLEGGLRAAGAVFLTVSLMHFWYDGFIWSVRSRQVG